MARRGSPILFVLALVAGVACRRPPPATSPVGDASDDAGPRVSTVLLGRDLDLNDVRWASNGDVIATTRVGVLRFAAEADAPAKLLRLPEGEAPARLATALHADVVALVTESQKLFVSRDGSAPREIARVGSPATVEVSDDGKLIAVDEPETSGRRTAGLRDAVTGRQLRTFDVFARFDPSSKFVASHDVIASVDGSSPDIPLGEDYFLVWVAGRAALAGKSALVLVDPITREAKRIPVCGDVNVDVERARAVTICKSRRTLEVVALPGGERTAVPLPASVAANVFLVGAAREGDDLFVHHGEANQAGEIHSPKLLRIDLRTLHTEDVPRETPGMRDLREDLTLESASLAKPPNGRRSLVGTSRKWPVLVRDARDREIARWGPDSSQGMAFTVRAHDRGIDLVHAVEHGVATTARVRLGPPAPGIPEERIGDSEMPTDVCARDAHVRLTDGRVLWYPFDKQDWQPAACACADFTCAKPFEGSGATVLDARPDTIVAASGDQPVKIRFTGPDGATRTSATIGDGASCKQARISVDGRTAGLYCTRTTEAPQDGGRAAPRRVEELVEIEIATGRETRRTKLSFPARGGPWTLEAVGKGAIVFSPPRYRWMSPGLAVVEPGTGRRIADVLALSNAAVARFDDGAVEIFGEETAAERAVRCEEGGLLRPFSTCGDRARVKGRFILDL